MSAEVMVDSIGQHVGVLASILTWGVVLAVGIGWPGLRDRDGFELAGLKVSRCEAFYLGTFVYVLANAAVLLTLWRINALLLLIKEPAHYIDAYTTLATHEWLLNPFAFLGTSSAGTYSTRWGIGLLIVSWWICITSVILLRSRQPLKAILPLFGLFFLLGLLSLAALHEIYQLNLERLKVMAPSIHDEIRKTAGGRWTAIFVSVPVGLLLCTVALAVQNVYRKRQVKNAHRQTSPTRK